MRQTIMCMLFTAVLAACTKEDIRAPQQSISAVTESNVTTTPYYTFGPWTLNPTGFKPDVLFKTVTAAETYARKWEAWFNSTLTISTFKVTARQATSSSLTLTKKRRGGAGETVQPTDPEPPVDNISYEIYFVFYDPIGGGSYACYLTITEDEHHNFVGASFTVNMTGTGFYGGMTTITGDAHGYPAQTDGGRVVSFTSEHDQDNSIGVGRFSMHRDFPFTIYGFVNLDARNDLISGVAYKKPRPTK